ncbi:recombinase family protein [Streptomyces sp. NPDC029004]|uniref:recombinase family protein n=1 Tax=Streptomyces sp. NPDC029004 TaxID=3154490 RepID=UPI00340AD82A
MTVPTLIAAAVVLTATVAAAICARRARTARRQLSREQAAVRLTGTVHHRDVSPSRTVRQAQNALDQANQILTHALAQDPSSRPKLDLVMQLLHEGDTLKVTRLDRLSRSVLHLETLGAELRERIIGLHVRPLSTT